MAAKFVIKKGTSGKFLFNLVAGNGQVIFTSESYSAKASAQGGVKSVSANAGDDSRFERRKATNGKPYFVMVAKNGEVIGRSQMYSSKSAMNKGIASVQANAPGAAVDDQS